MLKFNYALNLGLATLLVVPAVTLGSGGEDSLEATLQRTLKALDQLAAVEQRLQSGDASAIYTVIAATEAPLPTPPENPGARDALLDTLRTDVARLQGEAERRENATLPASAPQTSTSVPAPATTAATVEVAATTGLDDSLRARLGAATNRPREQTANAPTIAAATTTAADSKGSATRTFEQPGYAADALRLGRACYRQGRYAEALAAFELRLDDAECSYWRARSLEKLGRDIEAIAGFGAVVARKDAGSLAERAREDLEFLQWRVDFEKRSTGKEKRP